MSLHALAGLGVPQRSLRRVWRRSALVGAWMGHLGRARSPRGPCVPARRRDRRHALDAPADRRSSALALGRRRRAEPGDARLHRPCAAKRPRRAANRAARSAGEGSWRRRWESRRRPCSSRRCSAPSVSRGSSGGTRGRSGFRRRRRSTSSATSTWSSSRRYRGRRTHRSSRYSMLRRSGSWGARTS